VGWEKPSDVEESCGSVVKPRTEEKEAERRCNAAGGGSAGAAVASGKRESMRRSSSAGSFIALVGIGRGFSNGSV
jgi:hypothetical protein